MEFERPGNCSAHDCMKVLYLIIFIWMVVVAVGPVSSAPLRGPDLERCRPVRLPMRTTEIDCCFLTKGPVKDFKFDANLPMRVRRPVHLLEQSFVEKYNRAYELMKALPADDPRSFSSQANLHCAYCAAAYPQLNSSEVLDMHRNWLLFPFHRWYVYFHERILASLIEDDTFAIPFWQWDSQSQVEPVSNTIPGIFLNSESALYDQRRSLKHQPPVLVDLSFGPIHSKPDIMPVDVQLEVNLNMMHSKVVMPVHPLQFFGGKYVTGDPMPWVASSFEMGPHASIHAWVGDERQVIGEDLAPAYASARDPLFYAHHSNVDRIWTVWKDLGNGRRDIDDDDWLNAEFLFYDEHADLVRVNVADSLSIDKLRYRFEEVENDWIAYQPKSLSVEDQTQQRPTPFLGMWSVILSWLQHLKTVTIVEGQNSRKTSVRNKSLVVGNNFHVHLARPAKRPGFRCRILKENQRRCQTEEEIVIEGRVVSPWLHSVRFDVFINLPDADGYTPLSCAEYVSTFFNQVMSGNHFHGYGVENDVKGFFLRIPLGRKLIQLGISHLTSLSVTLVPKAHLSDREGGAHMSFVVLHDIRIEISRF